MIHVAAMQGEAERAIYFLKLVSLLHSTSQTNTNLGDKMTWIRC
jgi:hypothetical protein